MALEIVTPELALVDPNLAARARAALPDPGARQAARVARPSAPAPRGASETPSRTSHERPYPLWARVTAALWLLVIGILIGGAAIPHAQDKPRLIPSQDEPTAVCKAQPQQSRPSGPVTRFGFP